MELFNQFLEVKKDRNSEYLRELRIARDRWPELHEKLVCDITHRELDPILNKLTPGARNTHLRYLRAVFNFGLKKGLLSENPISRMDFVRRRRQEVETLTNKQVKAMLEHALTQDLDLLPFLVFGLFCGIRPDGELLLWTWASTVRPLYAVSIALES